MASDNEYLAQCNAATIYAAAKSGVASSVANIATSSSLLLPLVAAAGVPADRRYNLHSPEEGILLCAAGNTLQLIDTRSERQRVVFGQPHGLHAGFRDTEYGYADVARVFGIYFVVVDCSERYG